MFYFEVIFVFSVIFWVSAFIAETFVNSGCERSLPASARVAVGYLLSVAWFASALLVMPIQWGWALGAALWLLYGLSLPRTEASRVSRIETIFRVYFKAYLGMLVLANAFLLPLHMGRTYGPFTEGGGDVSVYADVAKYLSDHKEAAYGLKDVLHDVRHFIKFPFSGRPDNLESLAAVDPARENPPAADYSSYRFLGTRTFPSVQFSPTAQWEFLAGQTNYPIFYATLAFLYSSMVLAIWSFFRPFGRLSAGLAASLALASHGLVSVSYNVYFLQSLCLSICALLFLAGLKIPLKSWAGIRCFGIPVAIVLVGYAHYMAVIAPILLATLLQILPRLNRLRPEAIALLADENKPSPRIGIAASRAGADWRSLSRRLVSGCLLGFILFWTLVGIMESAAFFGPAVTQFLSRIASPDAISKPAVNVAMGESEVLFSWKWFEFFFGVRSQQHYLPFMFPSPLAVWGSAAAVFCGFVILALSLFLFVIPVGAQIVSSKIRPRFLAPRRADQKNFDANGLVKTAWLLCVWCFLTVAAHHSIAQGSLYTQAKGAQNVLIVLYIAMILPFAFQKHVPLKMIGRVNLNKIWLTFLLAFAVSMTVPRLVFALCLGFGLDRSGIVEDSLFQESARILREDPGAFVVLEPRKSADVFLTIQPFHGVRMVPTRHLVLSRLDIQRLKDGQVSVSKDLQVLGCDLITPADLSHLWRMRARKTGTHYFFSKAKHFSYRWERDRLADSTHPKLLLFAHDYETLLRERSRSEDEADQGWFSYVRNGAGLLLFPANTEGYNLEVKMEPHGESSTSSMLTEIEHWASVNGSDRSRTVRASTKMITITQQLAPSTQPQLFQLPKYWGEYWLNIRIDQKELALDPD